MMKKYGIIAILILVIAAFVIVPLLKENGGETEDTLMAKFDLPGSLIQVKYGQNTPIKFRIPEGLVKVELIYNDSIFETWNNPKEQIRTVAMQTNYYGVGTRPLVLRSTFQDQTVLENSCNIRVVSDIVPEKLLAKIVKEYPHSKENYTQGFEFDGNQLYEGTGDPGQLGKTLVGPVSLQTGTFSEPKNGLDATYFGEGITVLGDLVYQVTWQNSRCFFYDKKTMQLKGDFNYVGQGWGLCNDGKSIIMSDGSERITFRDPKSFQATKFIEVYDNLGPRTQLNELEYIDGKIYANVYTTSIVLVIEPTTGRVLEEIDASELVLRGKNGGDVLNGIAHNKLSNKTYMTGKYWTKTFEVQFQK
ncbi:glutaminyl-peptide cyclotransferase [Fluviicola taffensis]|uniref:Glutamine cyclotransferase n=1 Tax=Fluviicola taffensis (strain DSM 16823 / NCIMB 13979 / RW262) TaxID=755732 RepID=F2ICT9_FLUTR|nr:glutaminyl-peptide cyclotransferase [Fluviicola taffensis]AEA43313.1 glutamine cyclotransferase [Fluviicola taffensis DSM 16823]